MREIKQEDYLEFIKNHSEVVIGNSAVKLEGNFVIISNCSPSENYIPERTSVWSFPDRGKWATHRGNYRGNWSPYIPRNLILKYTEKNDWVLDQMMGSGTTLVEAKLLQRNAIGIDINLEAVMVSRDRLNFSCDSSVHNDYREPIIKTYWGDARNLDKIDNNSIDLIATHPPYANIISYSRKKKIESDLSSMPLKKYISGMKEVARESYRVLKPGKICSILIGDARKHKHYIPISNMIMEIFLNSGFILKEDIIKIQWNMKATRENWRAKQYDFFLIAHEHIFVFRKPENEKDLKKHRFSTKLWKDD
ncbi:TRM11 family SAM-dependent methyltransferase [Hippea sp. KM1]|uniref:TRM11 family SAM-dependent methyltransferase n=1 Tax=Hippea sp. KM1 TaxID=944481 RepID=UPI00046D7E93|nr:DNA methyltransferase [Hippea sp. KM1]